MLVLRVMGKTMSNFSVCTQEAVEYERREGKNMRPSRVFLHFLSTLPLSKWFTTEQSTVETSFFFSFMTERIQ